MRLTAPHLTLSATDLANFLTCRHLTALDLAAAHGGPRRPYLEDPLLDLLIERGAAHEAAFVATLAAQGRSVLDLREGRDTPADTIARTTAAIDQGIDVIVQGALGDGTWFGRPDILLRTGGPRTYEVVDTKLARTTKASMILQLCLYSDLLGQVLGAPPEHFHIVTPDPITPRQTYRFEDFAAYYRLVKRQCLAAVARGAEALQAEHYPEPIEHCEVCAWASTCQARRRQDDHLSLIAGVSRAQRRELEGRGVRTLTATAHLDLPIAFKPERGAKESYVRIREQARVQLASRGRNPPVHELIAAEPGAGLARLPEPSPGDVFLDLEGDPFAAEGGREYLFGLVTISADGSSRYTPYWATTEAEERTAFEAAMDLIMAARAQDPGMHVYHYAPYEPAAFKRLMGRHATRGDELDRLLREGRFVDLMAVVRQGVRIGVESYSIKRLEPLYGFERAVPLEEANACLQVMQMALERQATADLPAALRNGVAGYNEDDCLSTWRLRNWLETLRAEAVAAGAEIPRPVPESGDPPADVDDRARRVEALRERLLATVPADRATHDPDQHGRWILAYLLDWHRREDRAAWWEYFRLCALPEEDLFDEKKALAGLELAARLGAAPPTKGARSSRSVIDRYRYPAQEAEIDPDDDLKLQDGKKFGEVVAIDREARTIDIKKGPSRADQHPTAVFEHRYIDPKVIESALLAFGEIVADAGTLEAGPSAPARAGRDLLLRHPPRLRSRQFDGSASDPESAARAALDLDGSVLSLQGPPGSGKTYCGARMILAAVQAGLRVGVTATSHTVIDNLLAAVAAAATRDGVEVRLGHKDGEDPDAPPSVLRFDDNEPARQALADRAVHVLGATVWLWAREDFRDSVDLLFVDEAGQLSLANTVAASLAARRLVLLGDPQQLEQPIRGTHPEGAGGSALSHILGPHQTMPADRGMFLPVTRRLAPTIAAYTSEIFYERKLTSLPGLERQVLTGTGSFVGSGLWVVDVDHLGNRNFAKEEIDAVERLVATLTADGATWTDERGAVRPLTGADILIVAPYNAQVSRLADRLADRGVRVGTVDRFQGQEAPVAIYSMATSRAEDAPRGMEFLYSPNRLNVATSRARCAAIVVASPGLYEPECRSPRQMRLANGLCRFREMAGIVG